MTRTALVSAVLIAASLAPGPALAARADNAAKAQAEVAAADAAPFLGDWTLSMQGPNGPGSPSESERASR